MWGNFLSQRGPLLKTCLLVGLGLNVFSNPRAHAFTAALGAGSPAPSFFGVVGKQNFTDAFQIVLAAGYSSYSDLEVFSLNPQIRFYPEALSMNHNLSTSFDWFQFWFGGGVNFLFFGGTGTLQALEVDEDSAFPLAQLNLGADFLFFDAGILTLGCQFHFPIKLIFPFIEIGYRFH
jgi:hypothetical protein